MNAQAGPVDPARAYKTFISVDIMEYSLAIELAYGIRKCLELGGYEADSLFRQAGLDEAACVEGDATTLSDKLCHVWELVTESSGDPLLGLKIAPLQPPDRTGVVGHIMRASPDVKTAIENLVRYTSLVWPTIDSALDHLDDGRIRVSLELPGGQCPVPRQHYDFVWCMMLRTLQCTTGRSDLQPVLVTYAFPRPERSAAYADIYGCPVLFDEEANSMVIDRRALQIPIPATNPVAADWALRMLLDLTQSQRNWTLRMLKRIEQNQRSAPRFSIRVQQILEAVLIEGEPLREKVAKRLMMSERTLQRRLSQEGTSFTHLVDDMRRRLAQQYLSSREFSLKEIGFRLGFADPSIFCRACKRWFGVTPNQLRNGSAAEGAAPLPRAQAPGQQASRAMPRIPLKQH